MDKLYKIRNSVFLAVGLTLGGVLLAYAAPVSNVFRNVIPAANDTYDIGTTTPSAEWNNIYAKNLTLSGTLTGGGVANFSYLFPNNATTTSIAFNGGLTATTLTTSDNATTSTSVSGGAGGVYTYAVGSGNGTIGFNSQTGSYTAGVNGYGALGQLALSTGQFTFFSESNVNAGVAHAHTEAWHIDNTGLFYTPQGFISSASSTVSSNFHVSGNTDLLTRAAVGTTTQADDTFAVQTSGTKLIFDAYDDNGTSVFHVGNSGVVSMSAGIDSGYWNGTKIGILYGGTNLTSVGASNTVMVSDGSVMKFNTLATSQLTNDSGFLTSYDAFTHPATVQSATTTNMQLNGGASTTQMTVSNHLYIPNSTDPTVSFAGDVALNTTAASTSVRINDGTSERALYVAKPFGTTVSSSTLAYVGYSATATGTIMIPPSFRPTTITKIYCKTNTGTALLEVGTGSATTTQSTTYLVCTSSGTIQAPSSNNTFTMLQSRLAGIGSQTGNPDFITLTIQQREDAD